mmetsp:Transcript_18408/g.59422  ORF Transcript_18408/g.59422 Transcript_18408/m.59422 type:complete len:234 (+) Transcript_18408:181-882(+)
MAEGPGDCGVEGVLRVFWRGPLGGDLCRGRGAAEGGGEAGDPAGSAVLVEGVAEVGEELRPEEGRGEGREVGDLLGPFPFVAEGGVEEPRGPPPADGLPRFGDFEGRRRQHCDVVAHRPRHVSDGVPDLLRRAWVLHGRRHRPRPPVSLGAKGPLRLRRRLTRRRRVSGPVSPKPGRRLLLSVLLLCEGQSDGAVAVATTQGGVGEGLRVKGEDVLLLPDTSTGGPLVFCFPG